MKACEHDATDSPSLNLSSVLDFPRSGDYDGHSKQAVTEDGSLTNTDKGLRDRKKHHERGRDYSVREDDC